MEAGDGEMGGGMIREMPGWAVCCEAEGCEVCVKCVGVRERSLKA